MQLKSLEIAGFKSFADRTRFLFDNGITGIVGPNGCGKSNIVDSIRWVLGEQKMRNLRSEKMENIIFNGTDKRKKANFAEVSLTFENTKNILPTEYGTVTITRKLFRDGDSEYLINNVACRLKDIHDLFLDTGVGSDSYAIIELKMVDDILNDKDGSRRTLFEEAAGVSKYKLRKKQTLKKLQETEGDLSRVEDILFEIEKNLKSLETQAKKAKRYFELKEQYRVESSRHAFFKIHSLQKDYDQIEHSEQELTAQLSEASAGIALHEAKVEELKKEQLDHEQILTAAQKELNKHSEGIKEIETAKSIQNERLKYLQQREFAITDQLAQESEQKTKSEEELKFLSEKLEVQAKRMAEDEKELRIAEEALAVEKARFEKIRERVLAHMRESRESENALSSAKKEKEIIQIQIGGFENEIKRNEADKSQKSTELDTFTVELDKLSVEISEVEGKVNVLRKNKEENEEARENTQRQINELKDIIYKTNRSLDARANEYALTKDLVENLEGFPESVKFLKKEAQWVKDAPLLSDVLNAPEDYKVAIENLLEPYLNYYIVNSVSDALAAVHLLQNAAKGRANFFVLDAINNYKERIRIDFPNARPVLDLIEFGENYKKLATFLLDNVYVVDEDTQIPEEFPEDVIFISRSGTLSRRRFSLGGGSIGLFQGKRLGRAKNLEKLDLEIRKFESELNEQKVQLDRLEKSFEQLRQQNYSKDLDRENNILQQKKQHLSAVAAREQEYREFIFKAGERSDLVVEQIETLKQKTVDLGPEIEALEIRHKEAVHQHDESQRELEQTTHEVNVQTLGFNDTNIAFIQLRNLVENLRKDCKLRETDIQRLEESHTRLSNELGSTRNEIHELVQNNLQNDEEIISLYSLKKEMETGVGTLEEKAALIRSQVNQVDDAMKAERRKKDELEEQKNTLRDRVTEVKINLNSLKDRMQVEFNVDITALDEIELFGEKGSEGFNPAETETDMIKLRQRIQNYGEVNPMAVEAYNEMKERFDFINTQKQDLLDAKASLLQTIEEIDTTATQKFLESFTTIRDNFKRVFQTLFNEGDTCDLTLSQPDLPLESDIDIIAKPKGKRPLSINQLSGGEKTLTAISLLFAIYLVKPAPFCIFDEVDAPLDDANIDKFNNIVNEFSGESQFIIVTHNKRTMASTNVMYGVTMEESGVSKIAAVDLVALNLA